MKTQEMYDTIMKHLRKQKIRSTNEECCQYRGPEGVKCAIGCLIPDDLYNTHMEGNGITELIVDFPEVFVYLGVEHGTRKFAFLREMQLLHDDFFPVKGWIEDAHEIGKKYELEIKGR